MLELCPVGTWRRVVVPVCLLFLLLAIPAVAAAQPASQKRWGVSVSFTPTWTADLNLQQKLLWGPDDYPAHEGSAFTIGFVRGTARGSELGVNFVRTPIKDRETTTTDSFQACFGPNNAFCQSVVDNRTTVSRDVLVQGVEVVFFKSLHRGLEMPHRTVGVVLSLIILSVVAARPLAQQAPPSAPPAVTAAVPAGQPVVVLWSNGAPGSEARKDEPEAIKAEPGSARREWRAACRQAPRRRTCSPSFAAGS